MDWAEKYRPGQLQDIVGNGPAIRQILEWARIWTRKSKPLILYGKPGIGKTSAAHALASDMGWDVVELNASDQRTKAVIDRVAGSSSTTASLTGASQKLIIIDEADNLHGTADRGGARAILDLIRSSLQPIILIANDLYGIPKEIKSRCEPVQFKALPARSIIPRLRYICTCEGIKCTEEGLSAIAESSGGDLRAAVNILYATALGRSSVDDEMIHTSQKDERVSIFELIGALYRDGDDPTLMKMAYDVSDTPDAMIQWIAGNLHNISRTASLARAYESLSKADEFIGFTFKRQYYTLWRYATALMIIGTASSLEGERLSQRIMPPSHWKKMGSMRRQTAIRTAVLQKLAEKTHIPQNVLREEFLMPLTFLINDNPIGYAEELGLDKDELNFFLHDRERAADVMKTVTDRAKEQESRKQLTGKADAEEEEEDKTKKSQQSGKNQSTLFDRF